MSQAMPIFADVVDAADRLTTEEKEELVAILRRRLAEEGRRRLLADVEEAKREFAAGLVKPVTADELIREIES